MTASRQVSHASADHKDRSERHLPQKQGTWHTPADLAGQHDLLLDWRNAPRQKDFDRTDPRQPLLEMQRSIGNQAVLRRLTSGLDANLIAGQVRIHSADGDQQIGKRLQTKLEVDAPGDLHEQEADRVADQVMRMPSAPVPVSSANSLPGGIQRKCACGGTCTECQGKRFDHEGVSLQRKSVGASAPAAIPIPPIVHDVLRSPGRPLDRTTRAFIEPRFGHDFSKVQVHTDSHAADSARALQARAYTVGGDVIFAQNQFSPTTTTGMRLLAHELAHVVQQNGGTPTGGTARLTPVQGRIARSPDPDLLECPGGALAGIETLPPGKWLKCVRAGRIDLRNQDVLRFTETGVIVTREALFAWAARTGLSESVLIARVLSSGEFAGSQSARGDAANYLKTTSAIERSEELSDEAAARRNLEERRHKADEASRHQEAVRAGKEKRLRLRAEWLQGHGDPSDTVLDQPRGAYSAHGMIHLQSFGSEGELLHETFPSMNALKDSLSKTLPAITTQCQQLAEDMTFDYKLVRDIADQTIDDAAWYQRAGLAMVHLGYSKEALALGLQGLKRCAQAKREVQSGLSSLESGKLSDAARSLVDAQESYLTARHSVQSMKRQKDDDDESSLKQLENTSEAGDLATMVLAPGAQVGLGTFKNFATRVSTMHSDPNAEFGWKGFALETAGTIAGAKLTGRLKGADPSFLRSWASGMAGVQANKLIASGGDPGELVDVSAKDVIFTGAFSAVEAHSRSSSARRAERTGPEPSGPEGKPEVQGGPKIGVDQGSTTTPSTAGVFSNPPFSPSMGSPFEIPRSMLETQPSTPNSALSTSTETPDLPAVATPKPADTAAAPKATSSPTSSGIDDLATPAATPPAIAGPTSTAPPQPTPPSPKPTRKRASSQSKTKAEAKPKSKPKPKPKSKPKPKPKPKKAPAKASKSTKAAPGGVGAAPTFTIHSRTGNAWVTSEGDVLPRGSFTKKRSRSEQRRVSRGTGDDAGHRHAAGQAGDPTRENLARQNKIMNRYGTWRQLEKAFDKVVDQGIKVHRKVSDVFRPQDHGRTSWDANFATSLRDNPSQFRSYRRHVEWTLTDSNGNVETGQQDFLNTKTDEVRQKEGYKPPAIEYTDNLVPIGGGDTSDDD